MSSGPAFLGIGASRSGSTWLQYNLRRHPGIWMTPVKELHYFDVFRAGERWSPRRRYVYRRHLGSRALASARDMLSLAYDPRDFRWDIRYFLGRRGDDWYRSLFRPANGRVAGEVTPAYALVPDEVVGEIAAMLPHLKVIYIMRDPIARSWSNLSFDNGGIRPPGTGAEERKLIAQMSSGGIFERSDYLSTIATWERHIPRERIFYGFFDEIRERPRDLLLRLFDFLGVESSESRLAGDVERPRNARRNSGVAMTPGIEAALSGLHAGRLEALAERFGSYPGKWRDRARRVLDS
jgi:hypothetical protein